MNVKKFHPDAVIPKYAKPGDAGFDLVATEDVIIEPQSSAKVPIGLGFEIPEGFEIQIRPRSGITSRTPLRVQLGTIDSGYRGEVSVMVDNIAVAIITGMNFYGLTYKMVLYPLDIEGNFAEDDIFMDSYLEKTYVIRKGDRIAQGVLAPVASTAFVEVDELAPTDRGENGFGHSGTKVTGECSFCDGDAPIVWEDVDGKKACADCPEA